MRTTGLLALSVLQGLSVFADPGEIRCFWPFGDQSSEHQSQLQTTFEEPATNICNKALKETGDGQIVSLNAAGADFIVGSKKPINAQECNGAFAAIVSKCFEAENFAGGRYRLKDEVFYDITRLEPQHHQVEARAGKGGSKGGSGGGKKPPPPPPPPVSRKPTPQPSSKSTSKPTSQATSKATSAPASIPTSKPTSAIVSSQPTFIPSSQSTSIPSSQPTSAISSIPSSVPSSQSSSISTSVAPSTSTSNGLTSSQISSSSISSSGTPSSDISSSSVASSGTPSSAVSSSSTSDTAISSSATSSSLTPSSTISSSAISESQTSSSATPSPTKSCKQLYSLKLQESLASEKQVARGLRDGFVDRRTSIEQRSSTKDAKVCGTTLYAANYPDRAEMEAMTPSGKFYGFSSPETCDVFGFPNAGLGIPGVESGKDYQIEHVLEWQTVVNFFTWIKDKKKTRKQFDNPNPRRASVPKVDFCAYWKETWTGARSEEFPIDGSEPMTVEQHLKVAYPSLEHTPREFVWLQTTINSPAKANMWAYKNGNPALGIFNEPKMKRQIAGTRQTARNIDNAKEAFLDLKYLLGARRYMRNPAIATIFATQVNRMGAILDKIDQELPSHPKEGQNAWEAQGLGALWTEYMDEQFQNANRRTEKDMDTYIKLLRDTWSKPATDPAQQVAQKAFAQQIGKLNTEWMKEKSTAWKKPW